MQFLQAQQRLTLHGYVVMENHLHLIAAADNLGKEIGHFKSFTARAIGLSFSSGKILVVKAESQVGVSLEAAEAYQSGLD